MSPGGDGDPALRDDTGAVVRLPARVSRVVSLVPSLTETVAVTAPGLVAGATDWCTHPAGLDVPRVRGTKNPSTPRRANSPRNRESRSAAPSRLTGRPSSIPDLLRPQT